MGSRSTWTPRTGSQERGGVSKVTTDLLSGHLTASAPSPTQSTYSARNLGINSLRIFPVGFPVHAIPLGGRAANWKVATPRAAPPWAKNSPVRQGGGLSSAVSTHSPGSLGSPGEVQRRPRLLGSLIQGPPPCSPHAHGPGLYPVPLGMLPSAPSLATRPALAWPISRLAEGGLYTISPPLAWGYARTAGNNSHTPTEGYFGQRGMTGTPRPTVRLSICQTGSPGKTKGHEGSPLVKLGCRAESGHRCRLAGCTDSTEDAGKKFWHGIWVRFFRLTHPD